MTLLRLLVEPNSIFEVEMRSCVDSYAFQNLLNTFIFGTIIQCCNFEHCGISSVPGNTSIQFSEFSPDEFSLIPRNSSQFQNVIQLPQLQPIPGIPNRNRLQILGTNRLPHQNAWEWGCGPIRVRNSGNGVRPELYGIGRIDGSWFPGRKEFHDAQHRGIGSILYFRLKVQLGMPPQLGVKVKLS
jgi:hypothetical protein